MPGRAGRAHQLFYVLSDRADEEGRANERDGTAARANGNIADARIAE